MAPQDPDLLRHKDDEYAHARMRMRTWEEQRDFRQNVQLLWDAHQRIKGQLWLIAAEVPLVAAALGFLLHR